MPKGYSEAVNKRTDIYLKLICLLTVKEGICTAYILSNKTTKYSFLPYYR